VPPKGTSTATAAGDSELREVTTYQEPDPEFVTDEPNQATRLVGMSLSAISRPSTLRMFVNFDFVSAPH